MNHPGGGQKVNLLKNKLNELKSKEDKEKIVLFTDRLVRIHRYHCTVALF